MVAEARVPGTKIGNDDVILSQRPNLSEDIVPQAAIVAAEAARQQLPAITQLDLGSTPNIIKGEQHQKQTDHVGDDA